MNEVMNKPVNENVSLIDTLKQDSPASELDYQAYYVSPNKAPQKRLHIKQKGNIGSLFAYAYISRIEYTGSRLLSIIYHDAVVTIKGKNLDQLIDLLQDEKIRYLQGFDPLRFKAVSEQGEAVFIEKIEILGGGQ